MFHVGQQVVCTKPETVTAPPPCAVMGGVYTISEIMWHGDDVAYEPGLNFQFEELRFEGDVDWLPGFAAYRFRPVKTTSIEIFKAILVTPPKIPVEA